VASKYRLILSMPILNWSAIIGKPINLRTAYGSYLIVPAFGSTNLKNMERREGMAETSASQRHSVGSDAAAGPKLAGGPKPSTSHLAWNSDGRKRD